MNIRFTAVATALASAMMSSAASAALSVNITKSSDQAIPIAVVPFKQSAGNTSTNIAKVLREDLSSTGLFKAIPKTKMPAQPHAVSAVDYEAWQKASIDNLVLGDLAQAGGGDYQLRLHLVSAAAKNTMAGWQIKAGAGGLRNAAHVGANLIYKELLGTPGYFQSQLAYVTVSNENGNRRYRLMVSDYDGHNPSAVFTSSTPIMSPAFSPNGKKLAYVAFDMQKGRSSLRVQNLATGKIRTVSSRPGINGAPAWSPDGSKLAITLSKSGGPDIYIYDLNSSNLRRLTHTGGIDTEPTWSSDGKQIAFTSNRGGQPQIYRISTQGGDATRITYDGTSSQSPVYGPNGKRMAFVRQSKGKGYRVAIRNLSNQHTRIISEGSLDERPGFAPNGQAVIYDAQTGEHSLVIASVKGDTKTRLSQQGQVQDPAWGASGP
ncbi:Tol-Pal system beta propeller repeat protein TolB [Salinisphaera orenii]|uniref:Tol-Pal system beta propeller repeat protein TolB n=1 Tax=Salinisphaera orenii TaxID=856731 RepID=UPI001E658F52